MPWTPRSAPDQSSAEDPDEGSAIVEFALAGVVLLVPIMIFVGVLAQAQAAAFAAVASAQQGAQLLAAAEPGEVTTAQVQAAAALPAADQGLGDGEIVVTVTCSDGACAEPGAVATVTAVSIVDLPSIPFIGTVDVARMEHSTTVVVGRYS